LSDKSFKNALERLEQNEDGLINPASADKTAGKDNGNDMHIEETQDEKKTPKRGENANKLEDDTDTEINLQNVLGEQDGNELNDDDEFLKKTISPQNLHLNIQHAT